MLLRQYHDVIVEIRFALFLALAFGGELSVPGSLEVKSAHRLMSLETSSKFRNQSHDCHLSSHLHSLVRFRSELALRSGRMSSVEWAQIASYLHY